MKLGVLTSLYASRPLEEVLDIVRQAGLDCVEIGAGNFAGNAHVDVTALLGSAKRRQEYLAAFRSRGLVISALSCHGNPLHQSAEVAAASYRVFWRGVVLGEKIEGHIVHLFRCHSDVSPR